MKAFVLFIILLGVSISSRSDDGQCGAKSSPGQESFCDSLNKETCPAHHVCTWKSEVKTVNVVVEKKKSCVAKSGQSERKQLCENSDEDGCRFHESRCDWK